MLKKLSSLFKRVKDKPADSASGKTSHVDLLQRALHDRNVKAKLAMHYLSNNRAPVLYILSDTPVSAAETVSIEGKFRDMLRKTSLAQPEYLFWSFTLKVGGV